MFAPLLATLAGMVAELSVPGDPLSYWPVVLLLPGMLWVMMRPPTHPAATIVRLAICFFAGGWWLSFHPLALQPQTSTNPGEVAIVEGCVVSAVRRHPEQTRFVLEVEPGHRMQVSIYPRPGEDGPPVEYGNSVRVTARVRPPRNFGNPGAFDYERFLLRQRVFWLASATGTASVELRPQPCGQPALAWLHRTRGRLLARLAAQYEAGSFPNAYFAAILFGEDHALTPETLQHFRRAGLYHTLVISGQHVAILSGVLLLFLQVLPIPRWLRFLLTALSCWSYALISGYETPALRAACGVTLYLAGTLAYRRARPVNLISVVALVFLAWDPAQLLDTGFQLSFTAVLVIAGIAAPLQRKLFGNWPKVARGLGDPSMDPRLHPSIAQARVELRLVAQTFSLLFRIPAKVSILFTSVATMLLTGVGSLLLVSAVVQLGLSPLLVESFHRAPTLGPLANLVVSPLLGLMIPFAFLHLLVDLPLLGGMLGHLAQFTLHFTETMAALTPDLRIPNAPSWLLWLCAGCLLGLITVCEPFLARAPRMGKRTIATPPQSSLQPRYGSAPPQGYALSPLWNRLAGVRWRKPAVAALATITALAWVLLLLHPFAPKLAAGLLEITMLDVGQGESLLIVSPAGKTILVDTGGLGGYSSASRMDTGEDIVGPFLWSRGIRRLDLLILTHYDFDHAGGSPALLRAFRPEAVWVPGPPGDHPLGLRILAESAQLGIPVRERLAGDQVAMDGMQLQVLHPNTALPASQNSNRNSMVLLIRYGGSSALLTGDLERSGELRMIARGVVPKADLLKVAHHGSQSSTMDSWLDLVQPSLALISAGWLNPFRHPHRMVTDKLQRRGTAIWRTDRDGAITLYSNGLRWSTEIPKK